MTAEDLGRTPYRDRLDDLERIAERSGGTVTAAHALLGQVNLRLDPSLLDLAPHPLPRTPNTTLGDRQRRALWIGPDEWLILGGGGSGPQIVAELEAALAGVHHSVVDVSANRVALELRGPGRFTLLSKGCSLDLHPRAWRDGMCAQTMLAKAQVILGEVDGRTSILVRTSFADYLLDWLLEAARF